MIEFFFDISSPWTYLAFHNIQPLARELGVELRWKPILVGGIFNTINPTVYASRAQPVPAKQNYLAKDLRDWSRHSGLAIRFPPTVFPVNSVKVMRACIFLDPLDQLERFARAAFEAYWGEDQDISQDAVLRDICARVGIDAGTLLACIEEPAIKQQLRHNTEALIARGGFGSPTMFVNGGDMYFGNDRLELMRAALLREKIAGNPEGAGRSRT